MQPLYVLMVAGEDRTARPKAVPAAILTLIVQNLAGDVATDMRTGRDTQPHWMTHICVNEARILCDAAMLIELHTESSYHNIQYVCVNEGRKLCGALMPIGLHTESAYQDISLREPAW